MSASSVSADRRRAMFGTAMGPAISAALSDPRAQMITKEIDEVGYKDPMKFAATGAFIPTAYVDGTRQNCEPCAPAPDPMIAEYFAPRDVRPVGPTK